MKRLIFGLSLVVTLVAAVGLAAARRTRGAPASSLPSASDFYGDSWAVIIGINEYTNTRVPKRQYAVNDARSIHQSLITLGFRRDRIITLFDAEATKARIEGIIGDDLRHSGRVGVCCARQGKTDRGGSGEPEGYLLPVDGDPRPVVRDGDQYVGPPPDRGPAARPPDPVHRRRVLLGLCHLQPSDQRQPARRDAQETRHPDPPRWPPGRPGPGA